MPWQSLRVRLTLWYVAVLAVVLLSFSGVLYARLSTTLRDSLDDTLHSRATLTLEAITSNAGVPALDRTPLSPNSVRNGGEQFTRLFDARGAVVSDDTAAIGPVPMLASDIAAATHGTTTVRSLVTDGAVWRVITTPLLPPDRGVLQVGLSEENIHETVQTLFTILVTLVPVILLVATVGGGFLARRSLAPVDQITQAAHTIEATGLHARLPEPPVQDEIGRLARTLNALIARLEAAFTRERQFTADASHELRTPLTILAGEIEVTLRRERSVGEYQETLAVMQDEVSHLQALVADLLLLARSDTPVSLPDTVFDLAAIAGAVGTRLEPLTQAKAQTFTMHTAHVSVRGVENQLQRLVRNLLDNAIRYTPTGGTITLTMRGIGADAVIVVADTGPGIDPDALPHLFERFYRADAGRDRASGGSGLGLAIADAIAHRHAGTITVASAIGQGSTFTVTLPRVATPETARNLPPAT